MTTPPDVSRETILECETCNQQLIVSLGLERLLEVMVYVLIPARDDLIRGTDPWNAAQLEIDSSLSLGYQFMARLNSSLAHACSVPRETL